VRRGGESRYDTYLDYLAKVGRLAGFEVHRDKMRIPSTRNVCFVGLMMSGDMAAPLPLNDSDAEVHDSC